MRVESCQPNFFYLCSPYDAPCLGLECEVAELYQREIEDVIIDSVIAFSKKAYISLVVKESVGVVGPSW